MLCLNGKYYIEEMLDYNVIQRDRLRLMHVAVESTERWFASDLATLSELANSNKYIRRNINYCTRNIIALPVISGITLSVVLR